MFRSRKFEQLSSPKSFGKRENENKKKFNRKFCGKKHEYGRDFCPAYGKRRFKCNRPNHFTEVCMQAKRNIKFVSGERDQQCNDSSEDSLYCAETVSAISENKRQ